MLVLPFWSTPSTTKLLKKSAEEPIIEAALACSVPFDSKACFYFSGALTEEPFAWVARPTIESYA